MSAPRLPPLTGFRSALVVKPSSLGDIVHTLPAVQALRRAHPHLRLRWIANTEWTPLLEGSPLLDEVIPFPRRDFRGLRGLAKILRWAEVWHDLPREEPEIVFDFQGLLRSAFIARSRGSSRIIGLSDSREGAGLLHDHIIRVDPNAHAVDRYLALPQAFGIDVSRLPAEFPLPEGRAPEGWPDGDDRIVLHPWSRGAGKSLDPDVLEALCAALAPQPLVIVGVHRGERVPRGAHITDLSNRTSLAELVWVLRRARAVVSVDSGPMHIAAAVNDRTLGIHTWSDPRQVGPYNPQAWVWKAGRIARRQAFADEECQAALFVRPEHVAGLAGFIRRLGDKD